MDTNKKKYSRSKLHELSMICLYQFLVLVRVEEKPDLKEIITSTFDQPISEVDPLVKKIVISAMSNLNQIIFNLSNLLTEDWDFDRLNLINQAILILGYVEIVYADIPKPVAIKIAIDLARKFSDDDAYKIINGVLDKVNK